MEPDVVAESRRLIEEQADKKDDSCNEVLHGNAPEGGVHQRTKHDKCRANLLIFSPISKCQM